jgi:hypothetical protein
MNTSKDKIFNGKYRGASEKVKVPMAPKRIFKEDTVQTTDFNKKMRKLSQLRKLHAENGEKVA